MHKNHQLTIRRNIFRRFHVVTRKQYESRIRKTNRKFQKCALWFRLSDSAGPVICGVKWHPREFTIPFLRSSYQLRLSRICPRRAPPYLRRFVFGITTIPRDSAYAASSETVWVRVIHECRTVVKC